MIGLDEFEEYFMGCEWDHMFSSAGPPVASVS